MRVEINKSDCVIEKPVTAEEAAMYKSLHGAACTVILEEGDEGYEPQPEQSEEEASPAPSEETPDPAGVPETPPAESPAGE